MKTTNYRGNKVCCHICQEEELLGYKVHTSAFASAIDSSFIGWCKDHEPETKLYIQGLEQSKDRINSMSSDS